MARKRKRKGKKAPKQRRAKRQAESRPPIPDRRVMEGVMRQLVPGTGGPGTSLDVAQEIMYEAFEADSPRRQVALARKAIQTCPDCANAYVLLAEHAETLDEALDLYEQGVAAGERALGEEGFRQYEGHFWGFLETRPYMRARQGLAECLRVSGHREEENTRRTSGLSVTFGEAFEVAPRDFDAAQEHKWPVAGPAAYPWAIRINPGLAVRPPLAWELALLEGCLRAMPGFLDTDGPAWSGAVPTGSGKLAMRLSWVGRE